MIIKAINKNLRNIVTKLNNNVDITDQQIEIQTTYLKKCMTHGFGIGFVQGALCTLVPQARVVITLCGLTIQVADYLSLTEEMQTKFAAAKDDRDGWMYQYVTDTIIH